MTSPEPEVEDRLEYCHIVVDDEGQCTANYKWENLEVPGSMTHDEDVSSWSDEDVIEMVMDMIGGADADWKVVDLERYPASEDD